MPPPNTGRGRSMPTTMQTGFPVAPTPTTVTPAPSPMELARQAAGKVLGDVSMANAGIVADARHEERKKLSGESAAPFAVPFVAPTQKTQREVEMALTQSEKDAIARVRNQLSNSAVSQEQRVALQNMVHDYIKNRALGKPEVDVDALADEILGKKVGKNRDPDDIFRPGDTLPLPDRLNSGIRDAEKPGVQLALARADLARASSNPEISGLVGPAYERQVPDYPAGTTPYTTPFPRKVEPREEMPEPPRQSAGPTIAPEQQAIKKEAQSIAKETDVPTIINEVLEDMDKNPESPGWNIFDLIEAFTKGYAGQGQDTRLRREYAQMIEDKAREEQARIRREELQLAQQQDIEAQERNQQFTLRRDREGFQRDLELQKLRNLQQLGQAVPQQRPNFSALGAGLLD